jgi:hypothetical protein
VASSVPEPAAASLLIGVLLGGIVGGRTLWRRRAGGAGGA